MVFGSGITTFLDCQASHLYPSLDTRIIFVYLYREVIMHRQHLDKHSIGIPYYYYIVQASISTIRWKWSELDLQDIFRVLDSGH